MTETVITVQGEHTAIFTAERATVGVSVNYDGGDRRDVFDAANATAKALRERISELHDEQRGPITAWSSDAVRVWGDRPFNDSGAQLPVVYHATIGFTAQFSDFDALARFIETAAESDGITVSHLDWELAKEHIATATNDVRTLAVQDSVAKATVYANALGLAGVTATALADPGMLGDATSASGGGFRLASASRGLMDMGGSPQLSLRPEDIEVSVTVDARFVAS